MMTTLKATSKANSKPPKTGSWSGEARRSLTHPNAADIDILARCSSSEARGVRPNSSKPGWLKATFGGKCKVGHFGESCDPL